MTEILDSTLKKYSREISAGDYLFRQGESGNTMYIIMEGTVSLVAMKDRTERIAGTLVAGEVLGEKAILSEAPYVRTFSARAKTESIVLEFDSKSLKTILTKIPDFLLKILRMVSDRLDKANELISVLQSMDEVDRLTAYLLYYHKHFSKKVPHGQEVALTPDDINYAINVEPSRITDCLKLLTEKKILAKSPGGYLIPDENALRQYASTLKQLMAA